MYVYPGNLVYKSIDVNGLLSVNATPVERLRDALADDCRVYFWAVDPATYPSRPSCSA